MIYVNEKEIRESKDTFKEQFKFFEEKVEKIKNREHIPRGQTTYKFIDPKPYKFGNDGRKEAKKYYDISCTSSFMGVGWTWCSSSVIDAKGNRRYTPESTIFHEFRELNPSNTEEAELIFYFLYVCETAKHVMKLENLEEEAKKKNVADSDESAVKFLIMNDMSPISIKTTGSEDSLRNLASAYFVLNAQKISIELLKRQLFDTVLKSEKNRNVTERGFKEFIKEAYDISSVQIRIDIQRAIEKELIVYQEGKWIYKQVGKTICIVPVNLHTNPHKALINYLNINLNAKSEFDALLSHYGMKVEDTEIPEMNVPQNSPSNTEENKIPEEFKGLTREEIKLLHIGKRKGIAKKLGSEFPRDVKKEVVEEYIFEKLKI